MPSTPALSSVPTSLGEVTFEHLSPRDLADLDEGESMSIDTDKAHGIIRPWMGESDLPKNQMRYKIDPETQATTRLIAISPDEDVAANTFVIEWFSPRVSSVKKRTVLDYWRVMKPWQKVATLSFLAVDALALGSLALRNRTTPELEPQVSSVPPLIKKIDDTEKVQNGVLQLSQTRTIRYIMDVTGKSIPDLLLLNPSFFEAFRGISWESLPAQKVLSGVTINVGERKAALRDGLPDMTDPTLALGQIQENPEFQKKLDQYYTMLENMMGFECAMGDGRVIPKDVVGGSDVHGGEQYAGINMEAAKKSNNPQRLAHAQEIQACHLSGDQKKLQALVKTYYLLYYFPNEIQSHNPAITAFLLDMSMNRGKNSLSPLCQMVINEITQSGLPVTDGVSAEKDKEGNIFEKYNWRTEWTGSYQNLWSIVCQLYPDQVLTLLPKMREVYEDHTFGPRSTLRLGLTQRWSKAFDAAREMLHSMTYRYISYQDSISLIDASLVGDVPLVDTQGRPIIYRVQRIQNPNALQKPAEDTYRERITLKERPKKKMLLVHGTASGSAVPIVTPAGVTIPAANKNTRDKGGFNTLYQSLDACFGVTGEGLIFQFFDPTRGHGAANATHIATSTGIPKDFVNFNDLCIAIELCLRGYPRGQETPPEALYGVEQPTEAQQIASKNLINYICWLYGIEVVGTSADPVRNPQVCVDEHGRIRIGEKYLVPGAHCDDFAEKFRKIMGIRSASEMFEIFSNEEKLCAVFGLNRDAFISYKNQIAEKEASQKK